MTRQISGFLCAIGALLISHGVVADETPAAAVRGSSFSTLQVTALKTEHVIEPLGLETAHPRFRWLLESSQRGQLQAAYQILVASSLEKLQADIGDQWDSGKVTSDNSVEVPYAGLALSSAQRAYWKVRIWDRHGRPSAYGAPAAFEIGLLKASEWHGRWIAASKGVSSPLFRRTLSFDSAVRRARVYVSGIGYYELSINGKKIGDRVLDPASTTYDNDLPLKLKSRVLYATYDVTSALQSGENVLGVMLGHGWYSSEVPTTDVVLRRMPYGDRPKLMLQMNVELANGQVVKVGSDTSWKTSPGPIVYNDLANGETYDARRAQPGWDAPGFNDASWENASLAVPPSGVLTAQTLPPERVVQNMPLVLMIDAKSPELFEHARTADFGQHFSGWARISVSGPRGAKVTLRYAARIYPEDDTLDDRSNTSPVWEGRQTDTYILKGGGTEVWEPRFSLHGFRYVEVRASDDSVSVSKIEGRFVRSAVEPTSSFVSSNKLLNKIHHNIQWTLMTSLQGIPQDAAERGERVAYLGDVGFVAEDYLYNYDMAGFFEKWLVDVQDNQKPDGSVPDITPAHIREPDSLFWPSWQNPYPTLVWDLYQHYGDQEVLVDHYASVKQLANYFSAAAKTDGLVADEPLGDHMEPQADGTSRKSAQHTPQGLTANAHYYSSVLTVARIAEVLGHSEDARAYSKRAQRIKEAFNRRFFNSATNQYGSGSQTSNALPLSLGLVPPEKVAAVVKNLVDDVVRQHDTHLTTGIIGTNAVVQVLPQHEAAEVMYRLATQATYPSLGEQVMKGATAVCESYECAPWLSQNMKMFASFDKFFYCNLAGIAPVSPGYRRIRIQPQPVGDLKNVSASLNTVRGAIRVDWNKTNTFYDLKVAIPAGAQADIAVPTLGWTNVTIREGERTVWKSYAYIPGTPGLVNAKAEGKSILFQTGSGSYHFTLTGPIH